MALLHRRAYANQGRCWNAEEFANLLHDQSVITVTSACAFALTRVAFDQAELLMIACDPDEQRKGAATKLLKKTEVELRRLQVLEFFLEVAEDNTAAHALYAKTGFQEISRRRGYYNRQDGSKCDALVLRKPLSEPAK